MQDKLNKPYNMDNIEFLKTLPNNSISAIVSDVPYALCDIDALKMIKEGADNKGDFMNKKWILPTVDFLKECSRVLKDGAFFVTTFSPRQDLQCVFSYRLLEAGFDINFTPLLWAFCQGFPKASDYQKGATKRGVTEQTGEYLDGLKSLQLKPAYEVVLIAQKPYKAKSKIDQALVWYNERKELLDKGIKEEGLYLYTKNASGGVRIDKNEMFDGAMSSRIPISQDDFELNTKKASKENHGVKPFAGTNDKGTAVSTPKEGRFPATILTGSPIDFCEEDILDLHTTQTTHPILFELLEYIGLTLDDFKALSKEELKGIIAKLKKPLDVGRWSKGGSACNNVKSKIFTNEVNNYNSNAFEGGDLSRYFSLDAWTKNNLPELYKISKKTLELQEDAKKISPFLFTSKADNGSKNAGLEGFPLGEAPASARSKPAEGRQNALGEPRQNTNPCAKPISLYAYLINLFTHPHDLVLDPYCGSGTTPIACVLTNRHYIGLELEKEYFDIAEARVKFWKGQKECQENKTSTQDGTLI